MEAHLHAWLSLLVRWAHFTAGVAWIGASFYFNWLENHLQRRRPPDEIAGDLWAVHGGGFYYLKKFSVAPGELPGRLHWFKWEAYATWLSGMALLVLVFYWDARTWMVDGSVAGLSPSLAVATGVAALVMSWLFYDTLCRARVARREWLVALAMLTWFTALAWVLGQLLSGRAAYIHTGAALGTIMVANVFRVIIPAQKEMVAAVSRQRDPDPVRAANALQRSQHNNYLTLPVLFIMISSHFPASWAHPQNWLVLLLISLAGIGIRYYFNIRHLPGHGRWPLLAAGALLVFAIWYTAPPPVSRHAPGESARVASSTAMEIVTRHCVACHAPQPAFRGFAAAPLGVELDSYGKLLDNAGRVYQTVVVSRAMPLGNLTNMTETERQTVAAWFAGLQDRQPD